MSHVLHTPVLLSQNRDQYVAHLHFKSPEEIEEEDEFQDCLTVIQAESSSTSANNATIPTILTTAPPPSAEDDAVPPAASWRRLRGVLSATAAAAASRDAAETGAAEAAVKRRASVKGRWKSMRSRPQKERGSNVSDDLGTIHV